MRLPVSLYKTVISSVVLLTIFSAVSGQEPSRSPAGPAQPPAVPAIVGPAEIIVDRNSGMGSTVLNLRSTQPLNGGALTGVVNTDTEPKPQLTFKADQSAGQGQPVYPLTVDPKNLTMVVATVAGLKQAGSFDADLAYNGDNFGKLKIIYLPFAITIDGPDPNKADLTLVDEQVISLGLKNSDQVAYPVIWRLNVNGSEVCGDRLTLPANGVGLIQCKPSVPFTPARIQDLFKVESTEGNSLLFYPVLAGTNASFDKTSPWKKIPVKASISFFGARSQAFLGYIFILVLLILGGSASLLLSQALPHRLRQLNINDRLEDVARQTANLGSIGSRLQVLLRLERHRLETLLNSRNVLSPDFAGIAAKCNEGTTKLETRVRLAQQLDLALERLEQKLTLGPPPSQIAAIEQLIEEAKLLLSKTEPTDKDLEAAQTAITEAVRRCDLLNQKDDLFGTELANRVRTTRTDIDTNFVNDPVFQKLNTALPGPYKAVQRVKPDTPIAPEQYSEFDMAVEKLRLMKEYVLLYEGTQDKDMRDRLDQNLIPLLHALQVQSWPGMRAARLLMRQMKDDVYSGRLGELLKQRLASIMVKPMRAYDRSPLEFSVCFKSDSYEKAAAREGWTCRWDFDDGMNETGWSVSHYFELKRNSRVKPPPEGTEYVVKATFLDGDGNLLVDPVGNEPLTLPHPVKVFPSKSQPWFSARAKTEFVKLGAALFIAVFALVAGARDQVMKLDFWPGVIAVFTIGFGADTIKNLLTKSETTQ